MSEGTTHDRTATARRLALVSIALIGGAGVALTAAVIANANTTRMGPQSVTRHSWFWVGAGLVFAAAVTAVGALVAARRRRGSWSWPALSMGLVVVFVLVAGYVTALSQSHYVVEGRPRRRRLRGSRRRCGPASPRTDHGSTDGAATCARERTRCDATAPALGTAERRFVLQMWARTAAHETESIATFLQLRAELEVLGAPPALLERAAAAAEQEVGHARFALAMVERVRPRSAPPAGDLVGSMTFCEPERSSRTATGRRYRLLRLATEAYLDGCCNEAVAAERLRRAASMSSPTLSVALTAIEREERSHVELAWSTVEWSVAECGPLVAWTLRHLRPPRPDPGPVPPAGADPDVLRQWGWVDPGDPGDTVDRVHRAARLRLSDRSA